VGSRIQPENPAWRELLTAILEMRRILAAEAVALAAERHTTKDLDAMAEAAAAQMALAHDPLTFARGDIVFQRAVVRATGNVGLELLLNTFARFPDEQPELVAALYEDPAESVAFYPFVMELIRAGNANEARAMVRSVLDGVDRSWRARHLPERGARKKKTETATETKAKTTATKTATATATATKTQRKRKR
ncbi:MAG: FCD domain-containing protein, partial [Polyangiaceae bacterium]